MCQRNREHCRILLRQSDLSLVAHQCNGDEIVVSQPGIYTVSITQCGFTAQDSVEIIDGSFTASISTLDSLLCFDEMTTLVGTPRTRALNGTMDKLRAVVT